ncbi:hypothetical protein JMUB7538_27060 [Staphylococcus aureus]
MNAIQNSISLRKILVVSLSILTILSMVLEFNVQRSSSPKQK